MATTESRVRRPASSFQIRLEESARAVAGYKGQHDDEIEARDSIILEAVAEGCPVTLVARWAGISRPRVNQIVAEKWPR